MSTCGSFLSLNWRIEPAVAEKLSVRPGSETVCLVVESGGSRGRSAVAAAGFAPSPRGCAGPAGVGAVAVAAGAAGGAAFCASASGESEKASRTNAMREQRTAGHDLIVYGFSLLQPLMVQQCRPNQIPI